jgi:hypothetical protein
MANILKTGDEVAKLYICDVYSAAFGDADDPMYGRLWFKSSGGGFFGKKPPKKVKCKSLSLFKPQLLYMGLLSAFFLCVLKAFFVFLVLVSLPFVKRVITIGG